MNALVPSRYHVSQQRGQGHATQAGPPDIDVRALGNRAHHVHGFQDGAVVGFEPPFAVFGSRIAPADGEDLQSIGNQVAHQALVG